MSKKKKDEEYLRIHEEGNIITVRVPTSYHGLKRFFEDIQPMLRTFRVIGSAIVLVAVLNMREVFLTMEFSQDVAGTVVWLFSMMAITFWGFK